jgi:hypothetical protein
MEGLASSSISPDVARTQYVNHVGDCTRCRNADGKRRRMCKAGKQLKQQERDVCAAAIKRPGGAG